MKQEEVLYRPVSANEDLGADLITLKEFFSSVRVAICRIPFNVNINHGEFHRPMPLLKMIRNWEQERAELYEALVFPQGFTSRIHTEEQEGRKCYRY